jgi:demethylmenaquinone methyltransferase/2-methoxy-6-polyprenyl-1,4-benzoquinol methylase
MPFRAAFDCLWCGSPWRTNGPADLEGWAQLCSDCLGRAQDNAFLAFRLRAGIRDRGAERQAGREAGPEPRRDAGPEPRRDAGGDPATPGPGIEEPSTRIRAWFEALGSGWDDRYLRRGRYARGPVRDAAWMFELDAVTSWLDRLPLRGEILELAAGTGWWSPLLAQKGELWVTETNDEALGVARDRLVAHGLRAHLHVRDAWAEPDRSVDAVFTGHWLSLVPEDRLDAFLRLVVRWLRRGGTFAFIDRTGDPEVDAVDEAPPVDGVAARRLADGRELLIPQVPRSPDRLRRALLDAGFGSAEVGTTGRFFVRGAAYTRGP